MKFRKSSHIGQRLGQKVPQNDATYKLNIIGRQT